MFVGDIRDGIADTGVKAAILKCAHRRTGCDARRGAGAARRSRVRTAETGVPITRRTHPCRRSRRGLEQQKIFRTKRVST
jgi:phosphotriesterase-related protein